MFFNKKGVVKGCPKLVLVCLKSCEDGGLQKEDHELDEDEQEDTEGQTKHEQELEEKEEEEEQRDESDEVEAEETQQSQEEDQCADYPECTSLGYRESDGEKSLELPGSPRLLSQETRNLTASELLLNKSVEAISPA